MNKMAMIMMMMILMIIAVVVIMAMAITIIRTMMAKMVVSVRMKFTTERKIKDLILYVTQL